METCTIKDCGNVADGARGWCRMHYGRWHRWGDPEEGDHRSGKPKAGPCSVVDCGREHAAKGLCAKHYELQRRRPVGASYVCSLCGVAFEAQKRRSDGNTFCSRDCKDRARRQRPEYKAYNLARYYMRRYGMTPEEVATMRERGCEICGRTEAPGRWLGNMHIDHDHDTGLVRGVLCHGCNVGVGYFRNDPALLRKAADYLAS